jgi:hypothetical protein
VVFHGELHCFCERHWRLRKTDQRTLNLRLLAIVLRTGYNQEEHF